MFIGNRISWFGPVLWCFICFPPGSLLSQNKNKVDSLTQLIQTAKDTQKVDYLCELSTALYHHNFNESLRYAKQAYVMSNELNYNVGKATSLNLCAVNYASKNNYDKALEYSKLALLFCNNDSPFLQMKAKILTNIAGIHHLNNNLDHALKTYMRSMEVHDALGNKHTKAITLSNIGLIHRDIEDFKVAIDYFKKGKEIFETIKHDSILLAKTDYIIGETFGIIEEYDSAFKYLDLSYDLCEDLDYDAGKGEVYFRRGKIYMEFLEKDPSYFSKAKDNLKNAMEIFERLDQKTMIANTLRSLAELNLISKDYKNAITMANKSIEVGKQLEDIRVILPNYTTLYRSYRELNNEKKALYFYELHSSTQDSLEKENNAKEILNLESKYKMAQKEKRIALLKKDKELAVTKKRLSMLWYTIALIVVIICSSVWIRYRKNRYERELNELRSLKTKLESKKRVEKISSIHINYGKKIVPKKLVEVSYFNSENKYVFLNDREGKKFVVDYNMKTLEKLLPEQFIRVHNSYIINTHEIDEIIKSYNGRVFFKLNLPESTKIPSSLKYADNAKKIKTLHSI